MQDAEPRYLGDEKLGPDYEQQLDDAMDRIESLAVVKNVYIDTKRQRRILANLWCRGSHTSDSSQMRQPLCNVNKKPDDDPDTVPTLLIAAQKLYEKIESDHAACLPVAEAAKAAAAAGSCAGAGCSCSPMAPNAFEVMMRIQAARTRAAEANAVALAAEKERDAAEAEAESLQADMASKRSRTESGSADGAEAEPTAALDDWDLADHRREMTRIMNRRNDQLPLSVPSVEPRAPRTGRDGYLHHARTGLVGAVAYWAAGSLDLALSRCSSR